MARHFLNRRNKLVLPPNVMWPAPASAGSAGILNEMQWETADGMLWATGAEMQWE